MNFKKYLRRNHLKYNRESGKENIKDVDKKKEYVS